MGKEKVYGTCGLCVEEGKELRNSHIVPELAFRPLYDEKGRAKAFREASPQVSWDIQNGHKEHLLCQSCEQDCLNREYEQPFKKIWYDCGVVDQLGFTEHYVLRGLDYRRFKLFHMSVLLRASLSRKLEEYASVSLGTQHQEQIRAMVYEGDPGPAQLYPIECAAMRLRGTPGLFYEFWESPIRGKWRPNGPFHHGYRFFFAGCRWTYHITTRGSPDLLSACLSEDGTLPTLTEYWPRQPADR